MSGLGGGRQFTAAGAGEGTGVALVSSQRAPMDWRLLAYSMKMSEVTTLFEKDEKPLLKTR